MKVHNKGSIISRIISEYHKVAAENKQSTWIVTASTLISLKAIPAGGTSQIAFGILTSDVPVLPTEVRLNINDEFVITETMLCLYGIVGTSTGPAGIISNRYWTYSPYQLSNVFVALMPFWDTGLFNLLINGTQVIKNMDTNQFNWVPRTNDNIFVTPNGALQGNADWKDDGFIEMTPTITLSGARTNLPTITFQGGVVAPVNNFTFISSAANNVFFSINTAAWINRGVLAQNAAQFQGQHGGYEKAPDAQWIQKRMHSSPTA
jgi:hypothetical protein